MAYDIESALSECDREPINIPGAIQPFGTLIALDGQKIVWVSDNVHSMFGSTAAELLGQYIKVILGVEGERLVEIAAGRVDPTTPTMIRLNQSKSWVTAVAYEACGLTVIECEVMHPDGPEEMASLKFLAQKHDTVSAYLAFVVEGLKAVTKYDRVMVYKFADDWHGEVVAEAKDTNLPSFYGHHFPASDIPEPARKLFSANWVRMIPDANYVPVRLVSEGAREPLDLTKSALRSVSPIHVQYLQNMGVTASFTLSIISDGRLWGLIACHHMSAKYLPAHTRSVCGLITKMVSSRITSIEVASIIAARNKLSSLVRDVEKEVYASKSFLEVVSDNKHQLWKLLDSDGFTYTENGENISDGHAIETEKLATLVSEMQKSGHEVLHTTNVQKQFPALQADTYGGGVLAVRANYSWLIWNRPEIVKTVTWAGDPNKPLEPGAVLTPRASFSEWTERVRETSAPWQQHEIDVAEQLHKIMLQAEAGRQLAVDQASDVFLNELTESIKAQAKDLKARTED